MKTLILRNTAGDVDITIKADIFATNDQLQDPLFETRFTHMSFENYDSLAKSKINLQEIEYGWRSLISLVQDTTDLGMWLLDASEQMAQVDVATFAGTSGTLGVTIDGAEYAESFAFDLTTSASTFVSNNAAEILENHDITVTSDGADITFTGSKGTIHTYTDGGTSGGDASVTFVNTAGKASGGIQIVAI